MEIWLPILVVSIIGLICGVGLAVASHVMAVKEDERFPAIRECLPLYKAKEGKYDEAENLFKEADGYFVEGHHAHAAMIEAEGQGVETTVRLVLAHAEDQLMSAELTKTMVEEMIALYKKLDQLENK